MDAFLANPTVETAGKVGKRFSPSRADASTNPKVHFLILTIPGILSKYTRSLFFKCANAILNTPIESYPAQVWATCLTMFTSLLTNKFPNKLYEYSARFLKKTSDVMNVSATNIQIKDAFIKLSASIIALRQYSPDAFNDIQVTYFVDAVDNGVIINDNYIRAVLCILF